MKRFIILTSAVLSISACGGGSGSTPAPMPTTNVSCFTLNGANITNYTCSDAAVFVPN